MSPHACEANRALAQEAIILLTEDHWVQYKVRGKGKRRWRTKRAMGQLPDQQVNRLLVCGKCPRSGINPQVVKDLFREGLDDLIHSLEVYREYGYVPEVSHKKKLARGAKWREKNVDKIREKRQERDREIRIKQLKERDHG